MKSILKTGLVPKTATLFNILIPKKDREKPIIWLKEQCEYIRRDCKNCQIFDTPSICLQIDLNKIDLGKLKRVHTAAKDALKWWYYTGSIPPEAISGHFKQLTVEEKLNEVKK
ncbi:MAG: hypothetical protein IMZ61_15015 [Planctomycetes bacterium]|nr:hypothetical protein [Planctomycetota bacterium]